MGGRNYLIQARRSRICYAAVFILLLFVEIMIALYVHDSFVRPYLGDVLAVVVVYCFIRIFITGRVGVLPLGVFFFAACVEVMQYFQLVETLGITNRVARVVLGSTFDWADIVCYVVGYAFIILFERLFQRK